MKKHLYTLLLVVAVSIGFAQNNISTGNAQMLNNADNANTFVNLGNDNGNVVQGNFQQQQLFSNVNPGNADNNVGIPQQAVWSNPVNDTPSKDKSFSFDLPKPSFSNAGSSGRHHAKTMSKKMQKLNRRMSYVFSKKTKRSFHVDTCFAWAK